MLRGLALTATIGGTNGSMKVDIRVTEGIARGQGISSYIGYAIKVKKPTSISI